MKLGFQIRFSAFLSLFLLIALLGSCAANVSPSASDPAKTSEERSTEATVQPPTESFASLSEAISGTTATISPAPSAPSESSREETLPTDRLPLPEKPTFDRRFDGMTVRFLVCSDENDLSVLGVGIPEEGSETVSGPLADAVRARNEKVEEELGLKIVVQRCGRRDRELKAVLASEDDVFDVCAGSIEAGDFGTIDGMNCFMVLQSELNGRRIIDENALWIDRTLLEATAFYSESGWFIPPATQKRYGPGINVFFTGDLSLTTRQGLGAAFLNMDLWAKNADRIRALPSSGGFDDPWKIVENGFWTLGFFTDLSSLIYEDRNENQTLDRGDLFGLAVYGKNERYVGENGEVLYPNTTADLFAAGAGLISAALDEEQSRLISTVDSERQRAFGNAYHQLMCEAKTGCGIYDSRTSCLDLFAEGSVLLTVGRLGEAAEALKDAEGSYMILPLPLLDRSQFDPDDESLGYRTKLPADTQFFAVSRRVFQDEERFEAVRAAIALMSFYSSTELQDACLSSFPSSFGAFEERKDAIEFIRRGLYADVGEMALAFSDAKSRLGHDLPLTWFRTLYEDDPANMEKKLKKKAGLMQTYLDDYQTGLDAPLFIDPN